MKVFGRMLALVALAGSAPFFLFAYASLHAGVDTWHSYYPEP